MPDTTPPPVNPFKKAAAAANRANVFGIIAIILAIVAGVLAWFAWIEAHSFTQTIKLYARQISQRAKSTAQKEQNVISTFQNQLNTFQNKFNTLQEQVDKLSHISIQAHNLRTFSEASYLIHTANLQLIVSRNPNATLQLLKLAYKLLNQITSSNVTELKLVLAKDIVSLEKAPQLDVAKLLGRLEQLKTQVQQLPIFPTLTPNTQKTNEIQKSTHLSWYEKLGQSLGGLKELVIIRHEKKPIKPLLASQQLLFLKQNIQLKISEAEWAILYQNPRAYQQSLQRAKEMLETYYPNQDAISDTLKTIQSLSEINIKPDLPDLSNTLKILNKSVLRNNQ